MHFVHISRFLCKGNKKLVKLRRFFVFLYLCTKKLRQSKKMVEINEYRKELKSRIIDYAMGEFYKRGVRAVKMDEISQGLHVSKRTVYEIFGDKEELLLAGLKIKSLEMREKLETYSCNVAHNVVDIIGYFYKLQMEVNSMVGVAFYEEIHRMPRVIEFFKQEHEREFADRVKFLKAGVEEKLFRQDIDYSLTMELLSASMSEIMRNQIYKKYSMQQIFDNFFLVIIRGFCTERGAALLNKVIE